MCALIGTSILLSGCANTPRTGVEIDESQLRFIGFGSVDSVNPVPIEDESYIAEAAATGALIGALLGGLLVGPGDSDDAKRHRHPGNASSYKSASDFGVGMSIGGVAGGAIGAAVGGIRKLSADTPVQKVRLIVRCVTGNEASKKEQTYQVLQPVSEPAIVAGDTVRLFSDGVNTRAMLHSMAPRSRATQ